MPKASPLILCEKNLIYSVIKYSYAKGILSSSVKTPYLLCDKPFSMPNASPLILCEKNLIYSVIKYSYTKGILSFHMW